MIPAIDIQREAMQGEPRMRGDDPIDPDHNFFLRE